MPCSNKGTVICFEALQVLPTRSTCGEKPCAPYQIQTQRNMTQTVAQSFLLEVQTSPRATDCTESRASGARRLEVTRVPHTALDSYTLSLPKLAVWSHSTPGPGQEFQKHRTSRMCEHLTGSFKESAPTGQSSTCRVDRSVGAAGRGCVAGYTQGHLLAG